MVAVFIPRARADKVFTGGVPGERVYDHGTGAL